MSGTEALELLWVDARRTKQHEAAFDTISSLIRRDWAVRVLDAWRSAAVAPRKRAYEFDERGHLYICEWEPFARMGQMRDKYDGPPDAARTEAATAIFLSLPEAVQSEIGGRP